MDSILKENKRRGKRSRQVVFNKPENSRLSPWQYFGAMATVVLVMWLVVKYLALH